MKTKKSEIIGAVVTPLVVFIFLLVIFGEYGKYLAKLDDRLSEAEVEALRTEYPICGKVIPPMTTVHALTFEEAKEHADSFIYGTVEGDITFYTKRPIYCGVGDVQDRYKHTVSVIEDTGGMLRRGEKIELVEKIEYVDYNPRLTDGMKIVVPIRLASVDKKQFAFSVEGAYYVTDDGYAVSAFDEDRAMMEEPLSGIRVEKLMKELKQ